MNFCYNTEPAQFLIWLRDSAIRGNMPPQFIACIDDMYALHDMSAEQEAELDKMSAELELAQFDRDDLLGELEALIDTLQHHGAEEYPHTVEAAIKVAETAVVRHSK